MTVSQIVLAFGDLASFEAHRSVFRRTARGWDSSDDFLTTGPGLWAVVERPQMESAFSSHRRGFLLST